ncbi:sigma factor [Crossiella sp. S99.1]|uniref:sigma factor n=1 Tax=Crossiella sp. S99.1 TaxID=2936271 RepID=UPI001FFF9EB4|nr:sigma factor [Crossiella sp. S99.1]MCK2240668.1 hypothetical protein [Crossiella sp. S99.2]MCK2252881.1 hypothetical protein [Crossiella sp. S99.1]
MPPGIDLFMLVRLGWHAAEVILMNRYRRVARGFARHFSQCSGEQDQIVAETFLRLFRDVKNGSGPQNSTAFAFCLKPMVRRVATDRARRRAEERRADQAAERRHHAAVDLTKFSLPNKEKS